MSYQKALELIEENKKTQAPFLDLGNLSLVVFPEEILELTWLEGLNLGDSYYDPEKKEYVLTKNSGRFNRIKYFPDAISKLTNLTTLSLEENIIKDYSFLYHLSNLKVLCLGYCNITTLEFINNMNKLTVLSIYSNNVEKLDPLKNLSVLEYLNIGDSKNVNGLDFLEGLQNLSELDLSYNKLTGLQNLDKLPQNLSELDLSGNKITGLQNLDKLPQNLSKLNLSYNKITGLQNLDKLPQNLSKLYLNGNKITGLQNLDKLPQNLSYLNLSYNKITGLQNLDKLPQNLSELYLNGNKITGLQNLDKLPQNLSELYLSGNKITGLQNLDKLPQNLSKLYLSGNKITGLQNLDKLPQNLSELDLSGNKITSLQNLDKLPQNLSKLYLSYNKIIGLQNLDKLPQNLSELDLSENEITGLQNLDKLPQNLSKLYLSYNKITGLQNLDKLPQNLSYLNLSENEITGLQNLDKLPQNLSKLYLNGNEITGLQNLNKLPQNLSKLYLNGNEITGLQNLDKLPQNLSELDLSENKITGLQNLDKLPQNLSELDLSENKITGLQNLDKLPQNLSKLYLNGNEITGLQNLDKLPQNLSKLYLNGNEITGLQNLNKLPQNLSELDLSENNLKIQDLPSLRNLYSLSLGNNLSYNYESIFDWLRNSNVVELNLSGKPIMKIPPEITSLENCANDLRNWIHDLDEGIAYNYHAKIIVIGNGRVGKTSLIKALKGEKHNKNEPSSHGIISSEWNKAISVEINGKKEYLNLNFWDFGGQQLYHGTHRIFMQSRALFLLVYDLKTENDPISEEDGSDNHKLPYWLDYIRIYGKNSPVIIVQNKIREDFQVDAKPNIRKKDYPDIAIFNSHLPVDAEHRNNIDLLKDTIQDAFNNMPEIGMPMPKSWFLVREELIKLLKEGQYFIEYSTYEEICSKSKIREESRGSLINYLHQGGHIFYQQSNFGNRIILDQKKAIDVVYKLLNRKSVFKKLLEKEEGRFDKEVLYEYWEDREIEAIDKDLYWSFMKICEIFFSLDKEENKDTKYVIPQYLNEQIPFKISEKWTPRHHRSLHLQFSHSYFHAGIIDRFIVRVGHLSETRKSFWKNGISIDFKESKGLIEAKKEDGKWIIAIAVHGPERNELLFRVQQEFKQIYPEGLEFKTTGSIDGIYFVDLNKAETSLNAGELKIKSIGEEKEYDLNEFKPFFIKDLSTFDQERKTLFPEEEVKQKLKENAVNIKEEKGLSHLPSTRKETAIKSDPFIIFIDCSNNSEEKELQATLIQDIEQISENKGFQKTHLHTQESITIGKNPDIENLKMLEKTSLYIPIISPGFGKNDACIRRLKRAQEKWHEGEVSLLPILARSYYKINDLIDPRIEIFPKGEALFESTNKNQLNEDTYNDLKHCIIGHIDDYQSFNLI